MPSHLFCLIFVLLLDDILDQFHDIDYFQVISFFIGKTVSHSCTKNSSQMKIQISISSNSEFLCSTTWPLILKFNSSKKEWCFILFSLIHWFEENRQACWSCCKLVVIVFLMTEAQAGSCWACFYETFGVASTTTKDHSLKLMEYLSNFIWHSFGSCILAVYPSWPFSTGVLSSQVDFGQLPFKIALTRVLAGTLYTGHTGAHIPCSACHL